MTGHQISTDEPTGHLSRVHPLGNVDEWLANAPWLMKRAPRDVWLAVDADEEVRSVLLAISWAEGDAVKRMDDSLWFAMQMQAGRHEGTRMADAGRPARIEGTSTSARMVRLSALLKNGAILTSFVCIISILAWAMLNVIILGPFMATLVLIAAPILYWMGKIIEREEAPMG